MISVLDFRPAFHQSSNHAYWDFYVDDERLSETLRVCGIPPLGWLGEEFDLQYREMLLRKREGDVPVGRVPLFVCEICGDYECGVVSCEIELAQDGIVWRDFATHYNEGGEFRRDEDRDQWSDLKIVFDPHQYLISISTLAANPPKH
ncbi:MAG TPA: hypothetical protein VMM38_15270 [Aridibacter sp.]|nr:hypothetical protein [Aridibacter sp.]